MQADDRTRPWVHALECTLALVLIMAILWLPDDIGGFDFQRWQVWPLEWPPLVLSLLCVPRRWAGAVRVCVIGALLLIVVLKLSGLASTAAISRRLDPVLDVPLYAAGWNVFSGTIGRAAAWGCVALLVALLTLLGWTLARTLPALSRAGAQASVRLRRLAWAAATLGAVAALAWTISWNRLPGPGIRANTLALLGWHVHGWQNDWHDLRDYGARLKQPPVLPDQLLQRLKGHDVLLVFIESYGRDALQNPRFASVIGPRLDTATAQLTQAGFHSRSLWLESPTIGGQSWLAHSTLLSGQWINSQRRYDALVRSQWPSLNRVFKQAGWRTAGILPAITRAWPEGEWYGYDHTWTAPQLGYRGKPFNWITMPDQYTLSATERLVLERDHTEPVMAQVVLVSSHAPWTPIPPMVPWDQVADGAVFSRYADAGDPPDVVWRDPERVRDQYRDAIDYSLQAVTSFIRRHGDNALVIVLGDHPPAPLVTGSPDSRDVPIHVIARDPALLQPLAQAGWREGLRPDQNTPRWRMDTFAPRFLQMFSGQSPANADAATARDQVLGSPATSGPGGPGR